MVAAEEDGKKVKRERKETVTITELTDKKLVTEAMKGGKVETTELKK
jgi:hypothetical protein